MVDAREMWSECVALLRQIIPAVRVAMDRIGAASQRIEEPGEA